MPPETCRRSFLIGLGAVLAAPAIPLAAPELMPVKIRLDPAFGNRRIFFMSVIPSGEAPGPDFGRTFSVSRPRAEHPLSYWCLNSRASLLWTAVDDINTIVVRPGADVLVTIEPLRGSVGIEIASITSQGKLSEQFEWNDDRLTIHKPEFCEV